MRAVAPPSTIRVQDPVPLVDAAVWLPADSALRQLVAQ